jgi:hypothetical protein
MITITPREIDELLPNPGMGWQTFHKFADEDPALDGLPSTSAYFRLYWNEIEPVEGEIDFGQIDELLRRARQAGQTLSLRIMCLGTDEAYMHVPRWLKEKGCPGFEFQYDYDDVTRWAPDMDDEMFQEAHFRLIDELGKRYDAHPDFDLLDLGTIGLWGEWHMSETTGHIPSAETCTAIIDRYLRAFPTAPKAMLIADEPGMRHALANGCGWRADCLGDLDNAKGWNHMEDYYPQQIDKTGATDAWQTGPIAFESGWDMRTWQEKGWDIPYILDYALDLHASYMNNKSAPLPPDARPEVERFLRRLGYRLVLRELEHDAVISFDGPLAVRMVWENVGVAPPYRDYEIALRLQGDCEPASLTGTDASVKGWLPGEKVRVDVACSVAESGPIPGAYDVALAVLDPRTNQPIRLAIDGRDDDGWYPLSKVVSVAPRAR